MMKNSICKSVIVFMYVLLYAFITFFSSTVNAQSLNQLQNECNQGNITSCQTLRSIYNSGQNVSKNKFKSFKQFQRACDSGDLDGCVSLGMMYEKGIGVRKDKYKAAEIYRKACDGGNGSGCYYSGVIYARGDGFPRNESLAVLLFSIGCELGNSDSCLSFSTRSEIDSSASKEKLTEEQSRVSCNENETEKAGK